MREHIYGLASLSPSPSSLVYRPCFAFLPFHPTLLLSSSTCTFPSLTSPYTFVSILISLVGHHCTWMYTVRGRGGATTEGGGRGPPLFHSGLLCRTRSLECGFLRVFVSEARNSVCPLRLLEPGHGSSRRTLPIEQSGPLAGTRGVISQLACCTTTRLPSHTSARSRFLPRLLRAYTNVHHVIRFFIRRLSRRLPRESCNYKQAHSHASVLTTRRYALEERGRVIGWRSSGSRSS